MEKKKEKKERKREREIINSRKLQTTFLSLSYSNAEGGRKKEREGRGNAFKCSRSTVQKMTGTLTTGLDHGAQTVTVKIINV